MKDTSRELVDRSAILDQLDRDGSLRDIYAFETSAPIWFNLISRLVASELALDFRVDNVLTSDPAALLSAFDDPPAHASLRATYHGRTINAHFFTAREIEFDIDPAEWDASALDPLFDFTTLIAQATDRNVYLTHENSPESCIFATRTDGTIEIPFRPQRQTAFGSRLAAAMDRILRTFTDVAGQDPTADPPRSASTAQALARWSNVRHPNAYEWHTQLTAAEFRSLRELEVVLEVFYGQRTPEELCRLGGFELPALKLQFWQAIESTRKAFEPRSAAAGC